MKTVAFIFARGGSKGLPGKNIKPLAGKPMIDYAIETARACQQIDDVFVSTEDKAIAQAAVAAGARVINRPAELASDTSPEWLSWQHALEWVEEQYGSINCFVSLPVTSPLRAVEDVENALEALEQQDADICIGITEAARSPFFNMVKYRDDNSLGLVNEGQYARRQDVPPVYDITTVVYVARPEYVKRANSLFDGKVVGVKVPKVRAVDIDDIHDFRFAESLLNSK